MTAASHFEVHDMLGYVLRLLFIAVIVRLAARVLGALARRAPAGPAPARPRPSRRDTERPRLAGDIVDAEFEDLGDGRR
jgi:hypothetical protein